MSLMKALQEYLMTYPGMEMRPISELSTDVTGAGAGSAALTSLESGKTIVDVAGNRTYENNYVFHGREAVSGEADRKKNRDFLEEFCLWLETQNEKENFPALPEQYTVEELQAANLRLLDLYEDGTGLYQVQIKMVFTKRKGD